MLSKYFFPMVILLGFALPPAQAQVTTDTAEKTLSQAYDLKIDFYRDKARKQRRIGWILLGSGAALNIVTGSVDRDAVSPSTGSEILVGLGGAAITASIPFFFSASNNLNNQRLLEFAKDVELASSDAERRVALQDAVNYFSGKKSSNQITAIALTSVGGVLIVAGVLRQPNPDAYGLGEIFFDALAGPMMIMAGTSIVLGSIPFWIKASQHRRTINFILRTETIPKPRGMSVMDIIMSNEVLGFGVNIPLGGN